MEEINIELINNCKKLINELIEIKNENNQLKFLRICWIDVGNRIKSKSLCIDWIIETKPEILYIAISDVLMGIIPYFEKLAKGSNLSYSTKLVYLIPDIVNSKITILPYCNNNAQIYGSFYEINTSNSKLEPWLQCPREILKKSINKLKSNHQLSIKGSFEAEFYLIKRPGNGDDIKSIFQIQSQKKSEIGFISKSLDLSNDVLSKITDSLTQQGLPIEQLLKESGPGQFEITINYTNILEACDRHIIVRQTVSTIAAQNGYIGTFIPKLFDGFEGNGLHVHLSLWNENDNNITPIPIIDRNNIGKTNDNCGIGLITQQFIGGVLKHMKSLTAIFNTNSNSYYRLKPTVWNMNDIIWGIDNKAAIVRIPTNPLYINKGCTNFEIKTIDNTSNPYLVIASIIHSGIDGIENSIVIQPPNSALDKSKYIFEKIPSSVLEAVECLKQDKYLTDNLGPLITNTIIKVSEAVDEDLSKLSIDDTIVKLLELY